MFPTAVWAMLCLYIAWKGGISEGKLPAPYHFWGATGAMGFAALIGMLNKPTGNVLAVGLAVGAIMYYQTHPQNDVTVDAILLGGPGSAKPGGSTAAQGQMPGTGAPRAPINTAIPPNIIPGNNNRVGTPGVH